MRLLWFPLAMALDFLACMFISYGVSVHLDHVPAFLPYISDTGVLIPERTIFSELINASVFLQILFTYFRFEQVCSIRNYKLNLRMRTYNKWCAIVGLGIAFGLSLIGNAQLVHNEEYPEIIRKHKMTAAAQSESTNHTSSVVTASSNNDFAQVVPSPEPLMTSSHVEEAKMRDPNMEYAHLMQTIHWSGALFAFISGIFWLFGNAELTRQMGHRSYFIVRMIIAVSYAFFIFLGIGLAVAAATIDNGSLWEDTAPTMDTPKGRLTVAAAACEWMTCFLIVTFIFTFVPEFRYYEIRRISVFPVDAGSRSGKRGCNGDSPVNSPANINVTFAPATASSNAGTASSSNPTTEELSVLMPVTSPS